MVLEFLQSKIFCTCAIEVFYYTKRRIKLYIKNGNAILSTWVVITSVADTIMIERLTAIFWEIETRLKSSSDLINANCETIDATRPSKVLSVFNKRYRPHFDPMGKRNKIFNLTQKLAYSSKQYFSSIYDPSKLFKGRATL